jgi:hypothetical protein
LINYGIEQLRHWVLSLKASMILSIGDSSEISIFRSKLASLATHILIIAWI